MTDATSKKKPFAFEVGYELYDARGERLREVLLIENPGSGQALQLSIVNALLQEQETITLHRITQVTSSRYHFRLRFPANTLAPREASAEGADWAVLRVGNADEPTDVFLAWRSPDVMVAPGESLTAALYGVSAQPTVGAQVVMELKWPSPDAEPVDTAALTIVTPTGPGQPGDYELEADGALWAVPGYWDGERVCTLEKAPLVFGHKVDASHDYSSYVGIGNPTPTARLYLRGGHLRLHNAEVQNEGPLVFRSDADGTGESTSVQFFKKSETTPLMQLSASGDLSLEGNLSSKGNLNADGKLAIKGNVEADGHLTIKGRAKDKSGWLVPVGTIVAYGGYSAPEGWLLCRSDGGPVHAHADHLRDARAYPFRE